MRTRTIASTGAGFPTAFSIILIIMICAVQISHSHTGATTPGTLMFAAIDSSSTCCGIVTPFYSARAIRSTISSHHRHAQHHQEQNCGNQNLLHGIVSSLFFHLHSTTPDCFSVRRESDIFITIHLLVHFVSKPVHLSLYTKIVNESVLRKCTKEHMFRLFMHTYHVQSLQWAFVILKMPQKRHNKRSNNLAKDQYNQNHRQKHQTEPEQKPDHPEDDNDSENESDRASRSPTSTKQ